MSEGFETVTESEQLPQDWKLVPDGGTYRVAQMGEAAAGGCSLAMAGSGGSAKVTSHTIALKPNSLLLAQVWLKPKRVGNAQLFLGFDSSSGDEYEQPFARRTVATGTEEWDKYWCAFAVPPEVESTSAFFFTEIIGEGMVLIDDLQLSRHSVDPSIQLTNPGFESVGPNGRFEDWHLSADQGTAEAHQVSERPHGGSHCLRLAGQGKWCVVSQKLPVKVQDRLVLLSGYSRAKSGQARLKLEYFAGEERLGNSLSDTTAGTAWELLTVRGELGQYENVDAIRVSLAVENPSGDQAYLADFDTLNLFVVGP